MFNYEFVMKTNTNVLNDFVSRFSPADWRTIIGWITFVIILLSFAALITTYFVLRYFDKKFVPTVNYESSGARAYRIDSVHNSVTYFDLSNLREKKSITMEQFYDSFPDEEKTKVHTWIENILSGKQTTDFLQTNVYLKTHKKTTSSFLRITKSNPSSGLLHLESYLLQNAIRKKGNVPNTVFVTETQFANSIKKYGSSRGTTFCFTLKKKKGDAYENNVPRTVCNKFRTALDRYIYGNAQLMRLADNELLVCNFDINDHEEAVAYALRTINGVTNALTTKNKMNDAIYVVKAGIVANKDLFGDTESLIDYSQRTAMNAYDTSSSLVYYRKGVDDYVNFDVSKYRSEVEKIIFDKRINNFFQPVYGVSRHSVLGYVSKPVPDADRTSFATIEELKNYAIRAKDQNNLFGYLAKTIVSRFVSERPLRSQRLFYPIMVRELQTIPAIFSNLKGAKDANLMFLLKENDVLAGSKQIGMDNLCSLLKNVHESGFSLGLIVQGKAINADENILKLMDIFFVDFRNDDTDSKHMDMVIRSQLHALVEKLLKYKKIIVGSNLADWNAIELVVGSGIDYVASDQFGPYQNGFVPLKEKDEIRLKEMKGNRQ